MLTIFLYSVLFLVANVAMGAFMWQAIQRDNMFDILWNWQDRIIKMENNGFESKIKLSGKLKWLLSLFLGGCNKCFYHLISIISFFMYYAILKLVPKIWITDSVREWYWIGLINVIWYVTFVSIAWFISIKVNIKEPKKPKH